ncbi:MAG: metallophosphoesterase [Labilithrix sp.]|nr:metallophosphoesterase [Labilithrix sp.]
MATSSDRPMLVFVSDIHLTDALHNASIPRVDTFERFWTRITAARGHRPAHMCFVGDLFDIVRSPTWLETGMRPYDDPSEALAARVESIVAAVLAREAPFFAAIRKRVESGELTIHYVLGNHDRLLRVAPQARRAVWRALTGEDRDVDFGAELTFPDHGVLAYHGHRTDPVNYDPEGAATIGDAIGCDLIVGFPRAVRLETKAPHPELDDIDDVRPIYAVPSWVRHFGTFHPEMLGTIQRTWSGLVEGFLSGDFIRGWQRRRRSPFSVDTALKVRLLLELSTKKLIAKGSDRRLTGLYKFVQHGFDGKMAEAAAAQLRAGEGLRYVVNGHSHFANMTPLGSIDGKPAVYFNTGTWRSVHQIGHGLGGRPTFLHYDAMSYLVFFPEGDPLGRDYEWWTGSMIPR